MERIDRGYAIIYIDRNGELLKKAYSNVDGKFNRKVYNCEDEICSDYYNNAGPIQWNYYLIVAITEETPDQLLEIESNQKYARKFTMNSSVIDRFIEIMFPVYDATKSGTVTIVTGGCWTDVKRKAETLVKTSGGSLVPSFCREYDDFAALLRLDKLRALLIRTPQHYENNHAVFYSHMSREINLAKYKLDIFIKEEKKKELA